MISLFLSYLIGSIPTGFWMTWLIKKQDIRTLGSGNVGATNVFRSVSKPLGLIVLVLDILKGFLPVFVLPLFFKPLLQDPYFERLLLGFFTVCGHNWSCFLKFKGGKGVATTTGVVLAIFPKALLLALLVWIGTVLITRYVSIASIVAALSFMLWFVLFYRELPHFFTLLIISLIFIILIIYRHRSNIARLREGTEHRFGAKKK